MNVRLAIVLGLSCSLALSACSTAVAPPPAPVVSEEISPTATGGERQQKVVVQATVEKIDLKNRRVTLLGYDGTKETIDVGDEVRNLEQVKKGDQVVVTYYQSVAFDVLKHGAPQPQAEAANVVGAARAGDKPAAIDATMATIVVDVLKLDRKSSTASIRGPDGEVATVVVKNPAVFDKVKVGDRVEILLTSAVAIDVQPAPAKK